MLFKSEKLIQNTMVQSIFEIIHLSYDFKMFRIFVGSYGFWKISQKTPYGTTYVVSFYTGRRFSKRSTTPGKNYCRVYSLIGILVSNSCSDPTANEEIMWCKSQVLPSFRLDVLHYVHAEEKHRLHRGTTTVRYRLGTCVFA